MGRIQVVLSDDVEKGFRNKLAKEGKTKKGDISMEIQRLIEEDLGGARQPNEKGLSKKECIQLIKEYAPKATKKQVKELVEEVVSESSGF